LRGLFFLLSFQLPQRKEEAITASDMNKAPIVICMRKHQIVQKRNQYGEEDIDNERTRVLLENRTF